MQKFLSKKIIIGTVLFSLTTPSVEPLLAATVKSLKRTPQQNHYMGDKTQVVVQKPEVESEMTLWNTARKMMQDSNFSKMEIDDVENTAKKDIFYGRVSFLKNVLPELIDYAVRIRETEKLESPTTMGTEGSLITLVMATSAKYKLVEDTYGKTGKMEEIASSLFQAMGDALQKAKEEDFSLRRYMSKYLEDTKMVQEGRVALAAERQLISPFEYPFLNPPSLYYNRMLGYWTFFPRFDEHLPVERLFTYTDLGMIKDIPIPTRPYSLSYFSSWMVISTISKVVDAYEINPPEKIKQFTGQVSVEGKYVGEHEEERGKFGVGLEARSGPTYVGASVTTQDIYGKILNMATDPKSKEKFNVWVHKLNLGTSYTMENLDEVLNASFFQKAVPLGSTVLVLRRFGESYETWAYFKSPENKFVYIGRKEIKKEEGSNFFGVDVGKALVEGAGSTFLVISAVPYTRDMLDVGVAWDEDRKNSLFTLLFDPKIKEFLFTRQPKIMFELWKLNENIYGGGGVVAGKAGEDYYKIHMITGDKSEADLTLWNEKGFLNSAYVKTLEKYQGVLETKYKFPADILFYMAFADAESYVKKESTQDWAVILQKGGLKVQTSYNPSTLHLGKVTYEKNWYASLEFSDAMVNAIYSTPIQKDRFSLGLFFPTKIGSVGGEKFVYTRADGLLGYTTDFLFSFAEWAGKEGIKKIPGVNEVAVDDLKEKDPVAWTILSGLGIKHTYYLLAERGGISATLHRTAAAIYFTPEALKVMKEGKREAVQLFAAVEQNTGKVFVTVNGADKETIVKAGVNYYQISKGQIFRIDVGVEHIWYTPEGTEKTEQTYRYNVYATQQVAPSWGWFANFSAAPERMEFEGKGGLEVTFPATSLNKALTTISSPFVYTWMGMNWLFGAKWWPSEKPVEKPKAEKSKKK